MIKHKTSLNLFIFNALIYSLLFIKKAKGELVKTDDGAKITFEIPSIYGIFFVVIGFIIAYYVYFIIKK